MSHFNSKSARHRAREFALQGLYQWQVGGQDAPAIRLQAAGVPGFAKADEVLYVALLDETLKHAETLQNDLTPHITRDWNDVSPIERGVLLLGACELRYHPETPYRVVINECIELAKTFGGVDGHKFVNGVLDKTAAVLRPAEVGQG